MKLYEKDNLVILEDVENFAAKAIFTCGQAFRWYEEKDGSFTTVPKVGLSLGDDMLMLHQRLDFKPGYFIELKTIGIVGV